MGQYNRSHDWMASRTLDLAVELAEPMKDGEIVAIRVEPRGCSTLKKTAVPCETCQSGAYLYHYQKLERPQFLSRPLSLSGPEVVRFVCFALQVFKLLVMENIYLGSTKN